MISVKMLIIRVYDGSRRHLRILRGDIACPLCERLLLMTTIPTQAIGMEMHREFTRKRKPSTLVASRMRSTMLVEEVVPLLRAVAL